MTSIATGFLELEPQSEVLFGGISDIDAADDRLYLLTRSPSAVVIYRTSGAYVGCWGVDSFLHPHGLTIIDGLVHVVDQYAHDLRIFTLDGDELAAVGTSCAPSDTGFDSGLATYTLKYLSIMRSAGPFNNPTKAASGPDGTIYVTDGYGNARVHHFDRNHRLIRSWGEPGSGPRQFRLPHGLCVTADSVLVADRENDRVQCFDLDGGFVSEWTDVQRPAAIVPVAPDRFLVTELAWSTGQLSFVHGTIEIDMVARIALFDGGGSVVSRIEFSGDTLGEVARLQPHGLSAMVAGLAHVANLAGSATDPLPVVTINP